MKTLAIAALLAMGSLLVASCSSHHPVCMAHKVGNHRMSQR